jgi:capsular exopolysaccharide synthesis family protein
VALDLNLREIEYKRLHRSKENNERLFELILGRTKENDLTRMLRINNIHIVDRPLLPGRPIKPNVGLNISIGVALGLMFGVFAAMGRAFLDRTVKTPDDVTNELGLGFLGLLPEIDEGGISPAYGRKKRRHSRNKGTLRTRELIVHELPASGTAEASRAIRTNLLFMAPDHPYRSILVTSAGPSEGKTTVACCIAVAMAQAGQRVCLVDCDLRRPRLHRIFKERSDRGVTTAILAEEPGALVAMPTEITNLSVVTAGPIPPNPAELFHSQRFAAFVASLTAQFDRVIIDSPPIVAVTDAAVLSRLVDGVVMVVRAFSTTKDIVRHGARVLHDVGAKMAGIVLNAVDLNRQEYQYYYYYYHREGYYSQPAGGPRELPAPAEPPAPPS